MYLNAACQSWHHLQVLLQFSVFTLPSSWCPIRKSLLPLPLTLRPPVPSSAAPLSQLPPQNMASLFHGDTDLPSPSNEHHGMVHCLTSPVPWRKILIKSGQWKRSVSVSARPLVGHRVLISLLTVWRPPDTGHAILLRRSSALLHNETSMHRVRLALLTAPFLSH